jgi:DNA-binding PadR family transcriptional regulator
MTRPSSPRADDDLTPAMFHVLVALAERDRHGYAIMQAIDQRTGGRAEIGPGTLYRSIKRLLDAGLIVERQAGRRDAAASARREYRITERGRRAAADEARALAQVVEWAAAGRLLPRGGSS